MSLSKKQSKKVKSYTQRQVRSRARLITSSDRPRLSIFRSNNFLSAQIIDDNTAHTLVAVTEKDLDAKSKKLKKTERAEILGKLLADKAKTKKISKVVFDRGGYKYHGRVQRFAQGARSGGLEF